jgi:hypothetical protein|tara:strand:+ start:314 stop:613 length:300 start_codon:yes stop_codon:yes gene_type:complete
MNKLAKGNEGWSTKAKGIDRRKNPFKALITEATSQENFIAVFQTLEASAMSGDVQSAKLYLEYTVGKPMQSVDITSDGGSVNIPTISFTSAIDVTPENE